MQGQVLPLLRQGVSQSHPLPALPSTLKLSAHAGVYSSLLAPAITPTCSLWRVFGSGAFLGFLLSFQAAFKRVYSLCCCQ